MQIAGYDVGPNAPALLVAVDGELEPIPLRWGVDLVYPLGDRHCAGTIDGGIHRPCEDPTAPYCDVHARDWAPTYTDEEYAVYLAAFAPRTYKVGITRSWRLETRLREQGADRAAHVHTVSNGRIARDLEREIAAEVGESVRVTTKIEGLAASVDREDWVDLLAGFRVIDRFAFGYGIDIAKRPVAETVATGTVIGIKGRVLVLRHTGTTYAVDMRDLVGHEIAAEPERDRQASLRAFDDPS